MKKSLYGVHRDKIEMCLDNKIIEKFSSTGQKKTFILLCLYSFIKIIEESAKEAAEDIYKYIISNVADGIPYKYLGVPCGQRYFYEKRQKFFYLLSKKRG